MSNPLATVRQTPRDRDLGRDLRLGASVISFHGLHVLANIMLPIWIFILRLKQIFTFMPAN
jgi:hypothetical protein